MQNQDILSLIPQRPPFVMVDKLLAYDEMSAKTSFNIKAENVLVVDGEFTEAGLMENIAQSAAASEGYFASKNNEAVTSGYIGAVKNFEVFNLPKVGDDLVTEIKKEEQVFGVMIVSGTVVCKGVLMTRCEMNIFMGS